VQARGRRALTWTAVVLLVVGAGAYFVWNAPPVNLVPIARTFLLELEEGRHLQALNSGLMHDRWDLLGLMESSQVRARRLGRLIELEPLGPVEEVDLPKGLAHGRGKRQRVKGTFERGVNELVFTFARRGSRWVVRDFEFQSMDPPERPGLETHVHRMAMQVAESLAQLRLQSVHDRLVRADRIANPPEPWTLAMQPKIDGVGQLERIEERSWKYVDGLGTFVARMVFEQGTRDLELDLRYDPSEGRAVVTRLVLQP
jgi:hypothetical protein